MQHTTYDQASKYPKKQDSIRRRVKASRTPKYTPELIVSTLIKENTPLTREELAKAMGLKKEGGLGRRLARMVRKGVLVNFRAGTQPPGCRKPVLKNWGYWPKGIPIQDWDIDYQPIPPASSPPANVKLYHPSGVMVTLPLGVGCDPAAIYRAVDAALAGGFKGEKPHV